MKKMVSKNLKRSESITGKVIKYWFPVALWAMVIFSFSSMPTRPITKVHLKEFIIKKSAHILEYAIFSILMYRALKKSGMEKIKAGIYSIFLAVLYGISDELHQSFTPGRDPRIRDIVFDTIGATLAIWTIWKLLPKAPKRLKTWAKRLELI